MENTFRDLDNILYDPTTLSISITDPEGTVIGTFTYAANEIKRTSIGYYYLDHDIVASGVSGYYVASWDVEITAQSDVSEIQFYVKIASERLYCSVSSVQLQIGVNKVSMSTDDTRMVIREAMSEVDQIVGRTFSNANDKTEWFSTDQSNPNYTVRQLFLSYLPVQTVTSVAEYDTSKTLIKTYTDDEYWIDSNGILELCEDEFEHQRNRVKIIYTYGYSACPIKISRLTSVIAQLDLCKNMMIADNENVTGYSIEGISSVQIGESYTSIERVVAGLQKLKDQLIKELGSLRTDVFIC